MDARIQNVSFYAGHACGVRIRMQISATLTYYMLHVYVYVYILCTLIMYAYIVVRCIRVLDIIVYSPSHRRLRRTINWHVVLSFFRLYIIAAQTVCACIMIERERTIYFARRKLGQFQV